MNTTHLVDRYNAFRTDDVELKVNAYRRLLPDVTMAYSDAVDQGDTNSIISMAYLLEKIGDTLLTYELKKNYDDEIKELLR